MVSQGFTSWEKYAPAANDLVASCVQYTSPAAGPLKIYISGYNKAVSYVIIQ